MQWVILTSMNVTEADHVLWSSEGLYFLLHLKQMRLCLGIETLDVQFHWEYLEIIYYLK